MARAVTATIQRFRIDGVLGEGGMGTVYRAWDPELARPVALKVLASRPSQLELPERHTIDLRAPAPAATTGDQLLAEARLMAQISHPNVLPIYEVGRDGDVVFLVMELVEGDDLRRWMAAVPRTPAAILDAFVDRRPRPGRGPRARHPPPRPQARQHPDRSRRTGAGGRLRRLGHGGRPARARRRHGSRQRRPRHAGVHGARAVGRRRAERGQRRVRAGAERDRSAHRPA
jgi:hypothetical protein